MSEQDINLKALKKVDPYVKSIETQCSNVALYNFNSDRAEWERTQVEGTLFLFQRLAEPKYGFTIMNRLNPENHIEPVTGQLDFQIQPPFLLYKNSNGEIRGIWFFSKTECESVGKRIQVLVKEVEEEREERSRRGVGGGGGGGNLSSLLQNAEKSKVGSQVNQQQQQQQQPAPTQDTGMNLLRLLSQPENNNTLSKSPYQAPIQEEPETLVTSASVKDFFALASSNSNNLRATPQFGEPVAVSNVGMVPAGAAIMQSASIMQTGQPVGPMMAGFGMPPVITALPISQGLAMGAVPVHGFSPYAGNGSVPQLQTILSSPGAICLEKLEEEQRKSISPTVQPSTGRSPSPDVSSQPSVKGGSSGNLGDLSSKLKQQLQIGKKSAANLQQGEGNNVNGADVRLANGGGEASNKGTVNSLIRSQPTLLSPQVFSDSAENSPSPVLSTSSTQQQLLQGPGGKAGPAQFPSDRPSVTPLTATQISEALHYMLETDSGFVERLHEAYIQSLASKFKIVQ